MNIQHIHLMYFSPTHTTRRILEEIARGMGREAATVTDITPSEIRRQKPPVFENDLVLMGAPVYSGRLPKDAARYFSGLTARGALAVPVVLYGNRAYEDALLELKNTAEGCGFVSLAAGAFIGEHSFSGKEYIIAQNRPDKADLDKAFAFGQKIAGLLESVQTPGDINPLTVPGQFPFKEAVARGPMDFIQVTEDCDGCGVCIPVCPANAIDETNRYATRLERCIYCCACIKACPQGARIMKEGPLKGIAKMLSESFSARKEPETFFAGR
jgi:ferredoxin